MRSDNKISFEKVTEHNREQSEAWENASVAMHVLRVLLSEDSPGAGALEIYNQNAELVR